MDTPASHTASQRPRAPWRSARCAVSIEHGPVGHVVKLQFAALQFNGESPFATASWNPARANPAQLSPAPAAAESAPIAGRCAADRCPEVLMAQDGTLRDASGRPSVRRTARGEAPGATVMPSAESTGTVENASHAEAQDRSEVRDQQRCQHGTASPAAAGAKRR